MLIDSNLPRAYHRPTMQLKRFILFAASSVAAGLVAAFLALSLLSDGPAPELVEQAPPALPRTNQGPVSYAEAVRRAQPSVVNIFTAKMTVQRRNSLFDDPFFQRFFGDRFNTQPRRRLQTSLGSGVIINDQGYILTNHHVIAEADEIRAVLYNGRTLNASVVGTDPDTDLAVLKIDSTKLPAIAVNLEEDIQVGDVVLAIGNPFGVGQTVTMGIVSATGRDQLGINTFENFIQTDAAINPGNSGGALINAHGELVGINTAIFSRSGGSQGIGFAIPVDLAQGVMNQILEHGRVVRGWLGIAGQDITQELADSFGLKSRQGVLVSGVLDGGPADRAGIQPGDIITKIGDQAPQSSQDILDIISKLTPGSEVTIEGWRDEKAFTLVAVISERPKIENRR